jgi:hypothetical protein
MSVRQSAPAPTGRTAKKAQPRPTRRSKHWYAPVVVAVACATIIYWGTNWYLGSSRSLIAEQLAPTPADESRTGKIVVQTNPDQCAQREFDNTNGRFVDGLKPCDNQIKFDEHGVPIPLGTIHRLDSISRSFFGR